MTYGWAILIIIIVAGALYALGVFNPATYTGSRATGFATLGAPTEWAFDSTTNTFSIVLKNGLGESITVSDVTAEISGQSGSNTTSTTISPGSTALFTMTVSNTGLSTGDSYSAKVTIKYTKAGGTLTMTEMGTVTGIAA